MTSPVSRFRFHPLTFLAFAAMLACVLAANCLNCWTLEMDTVPVYRGGSASRREFTEFQSVGWPNSCISRTATIPIEFDPALGKRVRGAESAVYEWTMSRQLLVNILVLACLPIASAAVTERLIRNWRWPIQFRLSSVFWTVSALAILLAAMRTEQTLYADRGGGPIASLNPSVKVPILIGCLCTLYVVVIVARGAVARMTAVALASFRRLR